MNQLSITKLYINLLRDWSCIIRSYVHARCDSCKDALTSESNEPTEVFELFDDAVTSCSSSEFHDQVNRGGLTNPFKEAFAMGIHIGNCSSSFANINTKWKIVCHRIISVSVCQLFTESCEKDLTNLFYR